MKSKKQSALSLINSFIVGLVMFFLPKDNWFYIIFTYFNLVMGGLGVLLLIIIAVLSADD